MELFKKFNETIFYKNDSELEKQVTVLQKLNKEYPNNDIIANKLKIVNNRRKKNAITEQLRKCI